MAFITVSNSKKIIRKLDSVLLDEIAESIYKRDIYFFSKRESANMKGIRELFRDLDNFISEYYHPIKVIDTYKFLYPETSPSFHKDPICERLNSNFRNLEVPVAIQQKGNDKVLKFRDWYKNTSFKEDDIKDYIMKLQLKFPYVGEINPKSIEYKNTGSEFKKNYTLEELELEIEELLNKTEQYFDDNANIRDIIWRYQKMTFLAYIPGALKNNRSGLNDDTLKSFLKSYEETFKTPIKNRLIEYYKIKFNPDMEFDGNLLPKLGFKPCGVCLRNA